MLSTETLLHIWLSTEYYGFQPSSTAVRLHALDPTVPRKRMQIGFLLAQIVKEVSNIVSNLLMSFLLQSENMPIKCAIILISSNTWISWINAQLLYFLSREKVMVEPGTAISVSARSCRLFGVYGIACFFRRIELQHVALPVESNLPMSTVSVRSFVPPDH